MAMTVNKMLRICLVEMISACEENMIRFYHANEVAMTEFHKRAIDECRRRLRELGCHDLVKDEVWKEEALLHTVRSIAPNAVKMYDDLKSDVPETGNRAKCELWKDMWKEESTRAKRAKDITAPKSLGKRTKVAQDSVPDDGTSLGGTQRILRTLNNHLCAHIIVVPYSCIKVVKEIGSGSYGTCSQVQIEGVSFFPSTTIYCAKEYKGATHSKLTQFTTEKNMQKMHPSLVRCIGCTGEAPWVSIFPYYNGNTVHAMLMWLPYRRSSYRPMVEKLTARGASSRPQDFKPYDYELARICGFIENMPHIIHAIVNGMKDAHTVGFLHCDLHTRNVCLDFTREGLCKVGIIDWGLLLLEGQHRASETYTTGNSEDPEVIKEIKRREGALLQQRRPWMAPELFDPYVVSAYTKASDVYALGYLFLMMVEFWKFGQREFMQTEWTEHPDWRRIYLLEDQITRRMFVANISERVSLLELDLWMAEKLTTEPGRAQRPLIEMSPCFTI